MVIKNRKKIINAKGNCRQIIKRIHSLSLLKVFRGMQFHIGNGIFQRCHWRADDCHNGFASFLHKIPHGNIRLGPIGCRNCGTNAGVEPRLGMARFAGSFWHFPHLNQCINPLKAYCCADGKTREFACRRLAPEWNWSECFPFVWLWPFGCGCNGSAGQGLAQCAKAEEMPRNLSKSIQVRRRDNRECLQ
jgi:hypothetical protein